MTSQREKMAAQFARLNDHPTTATVEDKPMLAEQVKVPQWNARLSLTASPDMKQDLEQARVNDGVEATARIRAMITLWQTDERHRARVDKLARTLR